MPEIRLISDTWLPGDPDTGSHRLLPFEVPEGTARLDLRYKIKPLGGTGTCSLDLGLFGPDGFRGWSGDFRSELSLSAGEATPGYLRGPLEAGTWHVLVGADAAMLGSNGLCYEIEIELHEGPPGKAVPYPAYEPGVAEARQGWYRGNLHSHTFYSDGRNSIEEMAAEHLRLGLRFGALTEHNILNPDLAKGHRPGFVWLPSEEVTTYRGHLNAWGLAEWLDFRCEDEEGMQAVIEAARAQGAVTSINHPKDDGPPWDYDLFVAECMEVWQAPWFLGNYQSLMLWDRLLRQGRRIVAVGGSDLHRIGTPAEPYPYNLDNPTTWVRASALSVPGILEGISSGHVFISRDARGPQVYLSAEGGPVRAIGGDAAMLEREEGLKVCVDVVGGSGLLLRLVTQNGPVHIAPVLSDDFRAEYLWTEAGVEAASGPAYIRAEVIRDSGAGVDLEQEPSALWVEALTNPIYSFPADRSMTSVSRVEIESPIAIAVSK